MSYKDKFNQIIKCIEEGNFYEAKEIAKLINNKVEYENTLGVISYYEGNIEEAFKHLQNAIEIMPNHSDALFNYSKILFDSGKYAESWRYLTRIPEKTWEIYNLLGDTQLNLNNPAMAFHYYKKALELSKLPELKNKIEKIKSIIGKIAKIGIFEQSEDKTAIQNIVDIISNIYEIKIPKLSTNDIVQTYEWADLIWFENVSKIASEITKKLPKKGKKVILYSLEKDLDFSLIKEIDWYFIDFVVYPSEELKYIIESENEDLKSIKSFIVSTSIDIAKIKIEKKEKIKNILLDFSNFRKDPTEIAYIIKSLGKNYNFFIRNSFKMNDYFLKQLLFKLKSVNMEEYISFIDSSSPEKILENVDMVIFLDTLYPISEIVKLAMAKGIKVILANNTNRKNLFPNQILYNFPEDILEKLKIENNLLCRVIAEDLFSLDNQIKKILDIIEYKSDYELFSLSLLNIIEGKDGG